MEKGIHYTLKFNVKIKLTRWISPEKNTLIYSPQYAFSGILIGIFFVQSSFHNDHIKMASPQYTFSDVLKDQFFSAKLLSQQFTQIAPPQNVYSGDLIG